MNSSQAKQIPIDYFLETKGYKPVKTTQKENWYISPFREERTPSFKTNKIKNTYYDFGEWEGWTIIDLVTNLCNCTISEALYILWGGTGSSSLPTVAKKPSNTNQQSLEKEKQVMIRLQELENMNLIHYLQSRFINITCAKKYLKEVFYSYRGVEYSTIGFGNDSRQGYEIRDKNFKGFLWDKKDITTLNYRDNNKLIIFEWFMDFLSYLTIYKIENLQSTVCIMNSVNMYNRVIEYINNNKFEKVYFMLDNDKAWKKAKEDIIEWIKTVSVDRSNLYSEYTDLNDFLMNKVK